MCGRPPSSCSSERCGAAAGRLCSDTAASMSSSVILASRISLAMASVFSRNRFLQSSFGRPRRIGATSSFSDSQWRSRERGCDRSIRTVLMDACVNPAQAVLPMLSGYCPTGPLSWGSRRRFEFFQMGRAIQNKHFRAESAPCLGTDAGCRIPGCRWVWPGALWPPQSPPIRASEFRKERLE